MPSPPTSFERWKRLRAQLPEPRPLRHPLRIRQLGRRKTSGTSPRADDRCLEGLVARRSGRAGVAGRGGDDQGDGGERDSSDFHGWFCRRTGLGDRSYNNLIRPHPASHIRAAQIRSFPADLFLATAPYPLHGPTLDATRKWVGSGFSGFLGAILLRPRNIGCEPERRQPLIRLRFLPKFNIPPAVPKGDWNGPRFDSNSPRG